MRLPAGLGALLVLTAVLAGCLGAGPPDDPDDMGHIRAGGPSDAHPSHGFVTYRSSPDAWPAPERRPLPEPLSGLEHVAHVEGMQTAGGIAVFGPYAFVGHRTQGPLHIVDIQDPSMPRVVASVPDVPVRDADTIAYPDGRLVVITTAGGRNMFATDVTDPADARMVAQFETEHGNHNIAVVPGTPIVYNSGGGGRIDIVDFSDPEHPVQVGTFENGRGCHDTTFHIDRDAGVYRAYCAAYPETQIWDIEDPTAPRMVARIPFPAGPHGQAMPLSFSHLAMVNHDASILIVGDETGGGGINGCDYYLDTPLTGPTSGPYGNLWFYDLSNEEAPELLGHVSPSFVDALGGSCTAHFGRVIEDTNHLVMGFYGAGVVLVDFMDPSNPRIVDRLTPAGDPLSSIWDVWYYQGYLFTGDMARGMDVLTLR